MNPHFDFRAIFGCLGDNEEFSNFEENLLTPCSTEIKYSHGNIRTGKRTGQNLTIECCYQSSVQENFLQPLTILF